MAPHIDLGTVWHNCVLVRNTKGELDHFHSDETAALIRKELASYKKYNTAYDKDEGNVWFDLDQQFCFGTAQYKSWSGTPNLPTKDHSFFKDRKSFIKWSRDYVSKALKDNHVFKKQPIIQDSEHVIGYPDFLEKYKNKSVMIVGGGPSADAVNWDNVETDYLWSINKFYLNEKVATKGVDLATIASHIDILNDTELQEYMKKYNTIVSFELERGHVSAEYEKFLEIANFAKLFPNQTTFFHTRYKSQPGVGMRLICYAIMLGCSDVYFVGVDGFTKSGPLHAFEKDKKNPGWYKKHGNELQKRQYIIFWDYLLNLKMKYDYNIYNLGEDNEHNISGAISKLVNPLSDEIKEAIR
tara:strand:- start:251 stop:1315 length:1065 start_codon:yes stop_codon:yes gene_type:complete